MIRRLCLVNKTGKIFSSGVSVILRQQSFLAVDMMGATLFFSLASLSSVFLILIYYTSGNIWFYLCKLVRGEEVWGVLFPGGGSIGVILVNMIICVLNKMTMRKSSYWQVLSVCPTFIKTWRGFWSAISNFNHMGNRDVASTPYNINN